MIALVHVITTMHIRAGRFMRGLCLDDTMFDGKGFCSHPGPLVSGDTLHIDRPLQFYWARSACFVHEIWACTMRLIAEGP